MTTLFVAAHDEKTKQTKEPFEQQQRKRMYSKKLRSASGLRFRSPLHPPYSLFSSLLKVLLVLFPVLPSALPSQLSKIRGKECTLSL